jgi:two-component system, LytTR family, sensor kinase
MKILTNSLNTRKVLAAAIFILTVAIFIVGFLGPVSQNLSPLAEAGVIDLAGWDFKNNGILKLAGEWEFYWQQLLSYEDFQSDETQKLLLQRVPGTWNSITVDGRALPGHGYGTYRLQVKNYSAAEQMGGIYLDGVATSYQVWVNETPAGGRGEVGATAETAMPRHQPLRSYLLLPEGDFEIIIQVANFSFPRGGLWFDVAIGPASLMQHHQSMQTARQFFLIGILLLITLLALTVFFFRPQQVSHLYLALFSLGVTRLYDSLSLLTIYNVFPAASFNTVVRIWFVESVWIALLLVLFVSNLYPTRSALQVNRTLTGFALIYSAFYYLFPLEFTGNILVELNIIPLGYVLYSVAIVAIALLKKVRGSLFYAIGIGFLFFTLTHDILLFNRVISDRLGETIFYGLTAFVFCQALAQGVQFIDTTEKASRAELRFLQSQIRPHFINNALNAISAITLTDPAHSRRLLVDLSNYLQNSFQAIDLEQKVPIEQELELIRSYVALEQARFGEKLQVEYKVESNSFLLPPILLQPLVENAIVHGLRPKPEGGLAKVYIYIEKGTVVLGVKDNGVGMAEAALVNLAADPEKSSGQSGIGLQNIRQRLQKIYGSDLRVKSEPGRGTDISMRIPLERAVTDD